MAFILAVLALSALIAVPRIQGRGLEGATALDQKNYENEARRTVAQILAGGFLLLGAWQAWLAFNETRSQGVHARFLRWTEALDTSSNSIGVRAGAIHGLAALAGESEEYRWPVIEVLASYLQGMRSQQTRGECRRGTLEYGDFMLVRCADVQAAMRAIGSIPRTKGDHEQGNLINLARIDAQKTTLDGANFDRAIFMGANLSASALRGASLKRTIFTDACLTHADLTNASLNNANLVATDLTGATLNGANLTGAEMFGTRLGGVDLTGAIGLTSDQLGGACIDEKTRVPNGVHGGRRCGWDPRGITGCAAWATGEPKR
jgi:hypothetical protein